MKKFALLLSLVFVAGTAFAQAAKQAEAVKAPAKAASVAKAEAMEAEVVSVDAAAKTITIKGEPENKTLKVEGKALASLKTIKAGEKVTLEVANEAVLAIKAAKPAAPATK